LTSREVAENTTPHKASLVMFRVSIDQITHDPHDEDSDKHEESYDKLKCHYWDVLPQIATGRSAPPHRASLRGGDPGGVAAGRSHSKAGCDQYSIS
jgi:hypothetical protein